MPQFKRIGDARVAYGQLKFTAYSRAKGQKAKPYLEQQWLDLYLELCVKYEGIAQDIDTGMWQVYVTDVELDQMKELEAMADRVLRGEDYAGITDGNILDDLQPKRSHLIELTRRMDVEQ